jgi:hypothetical protein
MPASEAASHSGPLPDRAKSISHSGQVARSATRRDGQKAARTAVPQVVLWIEDSPPAQTIVLASVVVVSEVHAVTPARTPAAPLDGQPPAAGALAVHRQTGPKDGALPSRPLIGARPGETKACGQKAEAGPAEGSPDRPRTVEVSVGVSRAHRLVVAANGHSAIVPLGPAPTNPASDGQPSRLGREERKGRLDSGNGSPSSRALRAPVIAELTVRRAAPRVRLPAAKALKSALDPGSAGRFRVVSEETGHGLHRAARAEAEASAHVLKRARAGSRLSRLGATPHRPPAHRPGLRRGAGQHLPPLEFPVPAAQGPLPAARLAAASRVADPAAAQDRAEAQGRAEALGRVAGRAPASKASPGAVAQTGAAAAGGADRTIPRSPRAVFFTSSLDHFFTVHRSLFTVHCPLVTNPSPRASL